jgi:hypothetical protein
MPIKPKGRDKIIREFEGGVAHERASVPLLAGLRASRNQRANLGGIGEVSLNGLVR